MIYPVTITKDEAVAMLTVLARYSGMLQYWLSKPGRDAAAVADDEAKLAECNRLGDVLQAALDAGLQAHCQAITLAARCR